MISENTKNFLLVNGRKEKCQFKGSTTLWQVPLNAMKRCNKCIKNFFIAQTDYKIFQPNSLPAFTELEESCLGVNNVFFRITKK